MQNVFADDRSLFAIVKGKNKSANMLNKNLRRIPKQDYSWETLLNPDPSKPAQELVFFKEKETAKSSKHKS